MTDIGGRKSERAQSSAAVRYYMDADVLGLAKLLVQVRNDVTYIWVNSI